MMAQHPAASPTRWRASCGSDRSSPEEFDLFIAAETAKWAQVIRTAGVTPD
jgi:tripartite-type tricarboxylate transporter receptor subunit TctC